MTAFPFCRRASCFCDVLQDPDIQDVFKKSYSLEDLTIAEQEEEADSSGSADSSARQSYVSSAMTSQPCSLHDICTPIL